MSHAARKTPFPVQILGWLLASLSLLKLIKDITPIELFGVINRWVEAYASLVEAVFRPLLGWIKFGEIEIEPAEHHAIVLCIILGTAAGRAKYQYKIKNDEDPLIIPTVLFTVLAFISFSILAILLLPAQAS
ncbi:MAG: hypothetical protein QOH86_234, partial [Sphingomonadales bacterium]|nr:hypothetical protein [Sphingomonadales bacterium]